MSNITILFYEGSNQFDRESYSTESMATQDAIIKRSFNRLASQYNYRPTNETLWCIVLFDNAENSRYKYRNATNELFALTSKGWVSCYTEKEEQTFDYSVTPQDIYENIAGALVAGNYNQSIRDEWNEDKREDFDAFCDYWQVYDMARITRTFESLLYNCGIDNETEKSVVLDAITLHFLKAEKKALKNS